LLAVDGSEICRAYVALDGLVYVSLGELLEQVAAAVEAACELPVNVFEAAKPVYFCKMIYVSEALQHVTACSNICSFTILYHMYQITLKCDIRAYMRAV
jgi:hypothetical protein